LAVEPAGHTLMAVSFVVALQIPIRNASMGDGWTSWLLFLVGLGLVAGLIAWVEHRRGPRRIPDADREWHARAVMSELCPEGWTAEITVYGWGAPPPPDAPPSAQPLVSVVWSEFQATEYGEARKVVARRIWAPSVALAMEAMIADRRLDLDLEQIEQSAGLDASDFN
jgi:hypothetical protein